MLQVHNLTCDTYYYEDIAGVSIFNELHAIEMKIASGKEKREKKPSLNTFVESLLPPSFPYSMIHDILQTKSSYEP